MPCAEYEDRLLDYEELAIEVRRGVDAHLTGCAACREYLDLLAGVDAGLTRLYAGARVSPGFRHAVTEIAVTKVSFVPELLDLLGWAAIVALIWGAWLFVAPARALSIPALMVACGSAAVAAGWIGLRSFAELER